MFWESCCPRRHSSSRDIRLKLPRPPPLPQPEIIEARAIIGTICNRCLLFMMVFSAATGVQPCCHALTSAAVPEGDTIFRAARTLHLALAGKEVTSFETVLPALARIHEDAPLTGRRVERVGARGKNVLMVFSGDLVLRTHMRMNGSWHIYRPGERWQKARSNMRVVVGAGEFVAVAFNVPVAEFLTARDLKRHADLAAIGPDFLGESFDVEEALSRI